MARKIIYKKSGLNSQPTTPNGYKFVGYEDEIFSEKDGDIITPIGGAEEAIKKLITRVDELEKVVKGITENNS